VAGYRIKNFVGCVDSYYPTPFRRENCPMWGFHEKNIYWMAQSWAGLALEKEGSDVGEERGRKEGESVHNSQTELPNGFSSDLKQVA